MSVARNMKPGRAERAQGVGQGADAEEQAPQQLVGRQLRKRAAKGIVEAHQHRAKLALR